MEPTSAYLNAFASRDGHLVFSEYRGNDVLTSASHAYQHTRVWGFSRCLLECLDRVPTVGSSEYLYVERVSKAEYDTPSIQLYGVMQSILELVYQQGLVSGIDQVENYAEQTIHAVAERTKRNRMWDLIGANDGGTPFAYTVSTHHRDFGHMRIDDAQSVDNDSLIVGERDVIP